LQKPKKDLDNLLVISGLHTEVETDTASALDSMMHWTAAVLPEGKDKGKSKELQQDV